MPGILLQGAKEEEMDKIQRDNEAAISVGIKPLGSPATAKALQLRTNPIISMLPW